MAVQTIHSPKVQQQLNIIVEPGQTIAFDFDISAASFDRTGNNLTISIEGGGQIVLDNFFVTDATGALPPLRLADGTQVASNEFLQAIDPTLDITPEAAAVQSTGLNSYDASAGNGLAGLTGSEDLDSVFWTVEPGVVQEQEGAAAAAAADGPGNPPYTARAVLFGNDTTLNLRLDPSKTVDSVTNYSSGASMTTQLNPVDPGKGLYTLDVTPDPAGGKQYDYVTITYKDGSTQIIQVVVTNGQNWDSAAENLANPPAASGITNEWHTQRDLTTGTGGGRATNSDSVDEMWLNTLWTRTSGEDNIINTAGGADLIHVENAITALKANNTIIGSDESTLDVKAGLAAKGGDNTLQIGKVDITTVDAQNAIIVKAEGSDNVVDAAKGIELHIDQLGSGSKYSYIGVEALEGGSNTLSTSKAGADIDIAVKGNAAAAGVVADGAWGASKNVLNSAGDVNLDIAGGGTANTHVGAKVVDGGANSIEAQGDINVTVNSYGESPKAYGVLSQASTDKITANEAMGINTHAAGYNLLSADGKITIDLGGSSANAKSHGLYAGNDSGAGAQNPAGFEALNRLVANEVSIEVDGAAGAYGLVANSTVGGADKGDLNAHGNIISAGKVDVSVSSASMGYGMKATGGGSNTIQSNDVSINADAGVESYAMHAGRGGDLVQSENIIEAFSKDAPMHVVITATGNVASSFAMYAEDGGLNVIRGGNGNDLIQINGDIEAAGSGKNRIETGDGDNIVVLDGAITSADALILEGGDGYDKLVLKADSAADFKAKYETWLNEAADPANGLMKDFEAIELDTSGLSDPADVSSVMGYLQNTFAGVDIIYGLGDSAGAWAADALDAYHISGGLGEDSLDIGNLGNIHLSALEDSYSGFEHLELDGGQTLTIDSLLDGLHIDSGLSGTITDNTTDLDLTGSNILRVTGDEDADKVRVDPDTWGSSVGTVSYDNIDYTVYQHTDSLTNESQYLLIQTGLL